LSPLIGGWVCTTIANTYLADGFAVSPSIRTVTFFSANWDFG
jgi:hypothetical protein